MSELLTEERIELPMGAVKAVKFLPPNNVMRLLGTTGLIMAFALPIGVYPRILQSQELEHTHAAIISKLPTVTVVQATEAPSERTLSLPGTVEPDLETAVHGRISGYVSARLADIGDRVHAGQILASIETPEINESAREAHAQVLTNIANRAQTVANQDRAAADVDVAIAGLAQAKANLIEKQSDETFAQLSFKRWKILAAQGAVSDQDSDEKETRFKMALAGVEAAKDRIHAAESAIKAAKARAISEAASVTASSATIQVAVARENRIAAEKSFQNVVAPFSGVITERNIDQGSLVTAGSETSKTPLYRIARIDALKVFVDVPQYAVTAVKVGQPVVVTVKEIPGRKFIGKIMRTAVALSPATRTLRTEIQLPNSDLALSPGLYVNVDYSTTRSAKTFLIPSNALVIGAAGPQLVSVTGDRITYKAVTLGDDLGKQIEVVGGITAADQLVMNPADTLRNGDKVTIQH